ncbi:MAG: FAD-binding protein [Xanthobacteraceae bacterium]|nr:FAD-binding protein [Xanthobacteraceae bacterium]
MALLSISDIGLKADVLVIGGGPAGMWAAISAVQAGAKMFIVEKGYVGTSGPFSSANKGLYYIKPDDPIHREGTHAARLRSRRPDLDRTFGILMDQGLHALSRRVDACRGVA